MYLFRFFHEDHCDIVVGLNYSKSIFNGQKLQGAKYGSATRIIAILWSIFKFLVERTQEGVQSFTLNFPLQNLWYKF